MTTSSGRRGYLLLLILLMLLCILMEQYWVARFVPWCGALGSVQPMLVFLDIPLRLPVIDWLPVGVLLTAGYLVAISPDVTRYHPQPGQLFLKKAGAVFTAWWVLLMSILAGGGLFMLLGDQLPKGVYNGLDSFGLRADLQLPWFYPVVYHLHGSMLIGVTFSLGMSFLSRRASIMIPVAQPVGVSAGTADVAKRVASRQLPADSAAKRSAGEQAIAGNGAKRGGVDRQVSASAAKRGVVEQQVSAPAAKRGVAVLPPGPRPSQPQKPRVAPGFVTIVAPQPPGKGASYPCIVKGAIKPV